MRRVWSGFVGVWLRGQVGVRLTRVAGATYDLPLPRMGRWMES